MSKKSTQRSANAETDGRAKAAQLLAQQWEGPLPPPAALERFNEVIPDGANRIMRMVEQEQNHRHEQDQLALQAQIKDYRRGHYLGAGVSSIALAGAVISAWLGAHPAVSIALVGLPVATIILGLLGRRE